MHYIKTKFLLIFLYILTICLKLAALEAYNESDSNSSEFQFSVLESEEEEFVEELVVQPLASGFVNTYFQFTIKWFYKDKKNLHNTGLVHRSIAEILLQYDIKELQLSLTHGLWLYETWGYPVRDAQPGAEMWAWFAAENLTSKQVDDQWIHTASTLSGILCASLNFIDYTNTVSPKYGPRSQFVTPSSQNMSKYLRYASLPREIVCTENLTPWKKLLPCTSKNGFASLLNSGYVYNSHYHSLGIRLRTICIRKNQCMLEFTNSANLVFDPKLLTSYNSNNEFSLRRLFGQGLNGYCALAKSSKIYVNLATSSTYELSPPPHYNVTSVRGGYTNRYGVYDVQRFKNTRLFNIAWIPHKTNNILASIQQQQQSIALPPLVAHRFIVGQGQERGQLVTQLTNNYYKSLPIIILENVPWVMPVYLHTLKARNLQTNELTEPKVINYSSGVQRKRPYQLELMFEVPPKTTVEIILDFDYTFLKWLEYPPDANHGHYVGSSIIMTQLPIARNYSAVPSDGIHFSDSFNASRASYVLQLRTESLILSLPTPDFSMPYNVICLACTVVALAFGPIHSVATKRIIIEKEISASTLPQLFKKIRSLFKSLITKRKSSQEAANLSTPSNEADDNINKKCNHDVIVSAEIDAVKLETTK